MKEKLIKLYANKWFLFGSVTLLSFLCAGVPNFGMPLWFLWFVGWVIQYK
jgi:hypothetical protein